MLGRKFVWQLGNTTYTVRGPIDNSSWNVRFSSLTCLNTHPQAYIGPSASMLAAEFTLKDRKIFQKSKPATLMIADDFSGADTALTALILLLYSQEWYSSRVS